MKLVATTNVQQIDLLFEDASQELWELAQTSSPTRHAKERTTHLLNGGTYELVRQRISVEDRRIRGIFFTSSKTAHDIAACVKGRARRAEPVLDPTCGTGDLLLAYANLLPIKSTLHQTLTTWNSVLHGYDILDPFVRLTKLRLLLLLVKRGNFKIETPSSLKDIFPNIRHGDFIAAGRVEESVKVILANPPFSKVVMPASNSWGAGAVTAAAVFMDKLTKEGCACEIVAILPEVLRCGVRYRSWRRLLATRCDSQEKRKLGRFDRWTDVDVYLWHTQKRRVPRATPAQTQRADKSTLSLGRLTFSLRVGSVVPYRTPNKGPWVRYLDVTHAPRWGTVSAADLPSKRFEGTYCKPPFLVIRRTSSPGDKERVVATVVTGSLPVAVENHLIVVEPSDRKVSSCRQLLARLSRREVGLSLNRTMRCRHLTISSLAKLSLRE